MSQAATDNFLNKYKNGNIYNNSGSYIPPNYQAYQTQAANLSFSQNDNLAHEVLTQAGPTQVYHRPGYQHEVANVTRVTTEVSTQPGQTTTNVYKINQDHDPIRITRPIEPVLQKQVHRVRYLQPPEPAQHAPIIVKERQLTPPPPPPPIVIRQRAQAPPTPPPLIIRERAPTPPNIITQPTIVEKLLPPPTPPARQVIIERIPAPEKPREVIYEKWLPYKPVGDRPVIVERGKVYEKQQAPKNVIIEYENPKVNVQNQVYDEGVQRADPSTYNSTRSYNGEVRLVDKIHDLPLANQYGSPPPAQYTTYQAPVQTQITELPRPKSNLNLAARGPPGHMGPWNTTYRSSYTGRGYGAR